MTMELCIGIDVGSVSVNTFVADPPGSLLYEGYHRTNGLPFHTALKAIDEILARYPNSRIRHLGITGSSGAELATLIGGEHVNEVVAQSRAVAEEIPHVRTVMEMGGEDSKLLFFAEENGTCVLKDFCMNSLCAAGTGSFLDQQAARLGVSIENEFGEMALRSEAPPRIAGRCSVFAKSDMIHLQQVGTPVHDIVAGLCHALARNFKASIGRGKEFNSPIAFQGGVAANKGMVRAFENVLELKPGELIIPRYFASMGAIGALLIAKENGKGADFRGLDALRAHIAKPYDTNARIESLKSALTPNSAPDSKVYFDELKEGEKIGGYLGVDVGSISTNVVVIDENHRLISKRYLPTASRPIEAIARGLDEIYGEIGDRVQILAAGTTGSGRYLSGDLIGADVVCNEITAQATAAIDIDPDVDTIFEIGGQDSKYISIDNGAIVDFEMNKVCAAGTGSFLEEQAERLGIDLKNEFSQLALNAENPVPLGDRCTVFMESDLVHHQQAGAQKDNLLSGLSYSTVYNYLNRVVCGKRVGNHVFFQGGTAFNKGVVAAFNNVLGREVIVPPHHDVTGAIGVAIIAHLRKGSQPTRFKGFDLSKRKYELKSFECSACANRCEIHSVKVAGEKPLFYGSRCEKYDVDHARKKSNSIPNLFDEREKLLFEEFNKKCKGSKGVVGIPMVSVFYDQLPFWSAFFHELGFRIELSGVTNKTIINRGVEAVVSETCFPIKVAHGHILELLDKKPDFIFNPSIIDVPSEGVTRRDNSLYCCPYVQTLPYLAEAALNLKNGQTPVIAPALHMQAGSDNLMKELLPFAATLKSSKSEISRAIDAAYQAQKIFTDALQARGADILENIPPEQKIIVIIGRPYNTCDPGANLDLPKKLLSMNVLPIPMDMLPLDSIPKDPAWGNMYWRYGLRIMQAARFVRKRPRIYALYVTNFGCGPDSFLLKFFARELGDKPFLQIEIDEHSADAGVITRCEAYLDTIASFNGNTAKKTSHGPILALGQQHPRSTVYIPQMCSHAFILEAVFKSQGIEARVMDASDEESIRWGRKWTTGKECYPALLTTGDMIREINRKGFDPDRSAFFMPSANGPCRFGQYGMLHRHVLDDLGYHKIPIISLNQDVGYHNDTKGLNAASIRLLWQGFAALDAIDRLLYRTRPYEKNAGETDAVYQESLNDLSRALLNRKNVQQTVRSAAARFRKIPTHPKGTKPLIGIVGEIYIRSNAAGNENLIRDLESLGAEVAMPPITEWLNYVTLCRKTRNFYFKNYWNAFKDFLTEQYMHNTERTMSRMAGLRHLPFPKELLHLAEPYLHKSFSGEAILSIGKTIEYIRDCGASGVINVMPFTCMPGTIVTGLFKRIHDDYDGFPCISLSYAGQQTLNLRTRLEAFMYQARQNLAARSYLD